MSRFPGTRKSWTYVAVFVVAFLAPLYIRDPYNLHILISIGINIILASSLRLILTSGQLSLAHGAMMGVGAYTSALLVLKLGLTSWEALLPSGLAAAGLALLVGFPFVRLKGFYFAIVTLFLGQMFVLTCEQWDALTGGSMGIFGIPRPSPINLPGLLSIDFSSKAHFYYLIFLLAFGSLFFIYRIENSQVGISLISVQQGDSLAESLGVNTAKFKVLAFAAGCFFAGLVGGFYSHYTAVISPRAFGLSSSIYAMIYMVAGGMDRFSGPILGAIILTLLPEVFRGLREFEPFIFAGVLMLIIYFLPGGLIGIPERLKRFRRASYYPKSN
jgi:branched-chain amino acid transport system permease protein